MARSLIAWVVALVAGVALVGCGGDGSTPTEPAAAVPAPPESKTLFGTITALRREGDRWVLRLDPVLAFTGETANVAAVEDGVVDPGEGVPNDWYYVDEERRDYTFLVADDAEAVVLTRSDEGYGASTVDVAELARIVADESELTLFEPLSTGVWITYANDTVSRIVHQYRP